jgi:AcrR family transcriptional regulator
MTSDAPQGVLRRRGRPRRNGAAEGGAREDIVRAARRAFAERGYDDVSLRAVARDAGVDPALIHHYFPDKAELFAATMAIPVRPDRIVAEILAGPHDAIGASIVRAIVTRFEDPGVRGPILTLVRTALGHEFAARMLRQFLLREVLHRIAEALELPDGELRASFAATQIIGLIIARYGIRIGPLAEASPDEVIARIGPVVQWHLLGAPGGPPAS